MMRIDIAFTFMPCGGCRWEKLNNSPELDLISFQKEMAKKDVHLDYDVEEFRKDLETLEKLRRKPDHESSYRYVIIEANI